MMFPRFGAGVAANAECTESIHPRIRSANEAAWWASAGPCAGGLEYWKVRHRILEAAGDGNWRVRRSQILEGERWWRRGMGPRVGDGMRRRAGGSQKDGRGSRVFVFCSHGVGGEDSSKPRLERVVVAGE